MGRIVNIGRIVAVAVAVVATLSALVVGARPALAASGSIPDFAPDEFVAFLERAPLPGTTPPGPAPSITGAAAADARIRVLAEATDYRRRPESTLNVTRVAGVVLNAEAGQAVVQMAAKAAAVGAPFSAASGFRSIDDQRRIFLDQLTAQGYQRIGRPYSASEIASGAADGAVTEVLRLNSIPGYSFHHTGDAVDLVAPGGSLGSFSSSAAYRWLSVDNYANAKAFGFVPSYPVGAGRIGPEPEPWEFTFVGGRSLRCANNVLLLADRTPGRCPVGNLDGVVTNGTTVTVGGWAADDDAPSTPLDVHISIDGAIQPVRADRDRPDVGAATPYGPRHGYEAVFTVPYGSHSVCAYALNDVPGEDNTLLGCRYVSVRTIPPIGTVDQVAPSGPGIQVDGWAVDPDLPGATLDVHVYVDGQAVAVRAERPRADVDAVTGLGPNHGFSAFLGASAGVHRVCAYGISTQPGEGNPLLGCRLVVARGTRPPGGNFEAVRPEGDGLSATGWAADPDHPSTPVDVHVYVDGRFGALVSSDRERADVAAATPFGARHGFAATVAASPGPHQVCAYAIALDAGEPNVLLGCRTVTL